MAALNDNGVSCVSLFSSLTASQVKKNEDTVSLRDEVRLERSNVSNQYSDTNELNDQVLDIVINNVVCSFNLKCHLNLKYIAMNGCNVEYRRENGMVTMKLRNPCTTASIWSSGKITCTGATSDSDAKKASRRFARVIQQLGFKVKFSNFRVVNVLGTCMMPFGIKISQFSAKHRQCASYEPELHPGVTYKVKDLKATMKIFSTGNITITAPTIENVQKAVEYIFPLVHEYKKDKPAQLRNFRTVEFLKQENRSGLNDEQLCHKLNPEVKK